MKVLKVVLNIHMQAHTHMCIYTHFQALTQPHRHTHMQVHTLARTDKCRYTHIQAYVHIVLWT